MPRFEIVLKAASPSGQKDSRARRSRGNEAPFALHEKHVSSAGVFFG